MQFAPTEDSGFPRVESRMLLAGEAGRGTVDVNSASVPVGLETIMVMPWGHRVCYHPDRRDPFLVYGTHLIPWHAAAVEGRAQRAASRSSAGSVGDPGRPRTGHRSGAVVP